MITFRTVTDLQEAKSLWNMLTPTTTMYDAWDFRYCFYKYFNYRLHFIVGEDGGLPIGLLPLQWNEKEGHLEFFGGAVMRDNRVFIKADYEDQIEKFYGAATLPLRALDVAGTDSFTTRLPLSTNKYIIQLGEFTSASDYLVKALSSKYRSDIKRKLKTIDPNRVTIAINQFSDIDLLITYNKASFGADSSFHKEHREAIFKDLLQLPYQIVLLSFIIDGVVEAVSLAIVFKKTYHFINSGSNKKKYPSMPTFVTFANIDKAKELHAEIFDAGVDDLGWKENWGLQKIPQYKFEK